MSGVVIWAGGVAPEAYVLELSSIGGVALSTVTAAVMVVVLLVLIWLLDVFFGLGHLGHVRVGR